MKSVTAILTLAATTILGAAVDKTQVAPPEKYNLTLVLDVDDSGTVPVWRLLEENLPDHVKNATYDDEPMDIQARDVLDKRGRVDCFRTNPARNDDCRRLYNSIQYSRQPVPNAPRHIVYATCYISWSAPFSADLSYFWSAAYDTSHTCGFYHPEQYNAVSGVGRGYLPNGANQCLSGRPNGCT